MATKRQQAADKNLTELHESIAAAVETMQTPQGWKAWLELSAVLPQYSLNNQLALLRQCQQRGIQPTSFASFRTWKEAGYPVRRGEASFRILGPVLGKKPHDRTTGARLSDDEAQSRPSSEVTWKRVPVAYKAVPTFEVSQTEAAGLTEIPEELRPQLPTGPAPEGLISRLTAFAADHGTPVEYRPLADLGGAHGFFQPDTGSNGRLIVVGDDLDEAAKAKTLIHEIAHMRLHTQPGATARHTAEIEAESTAYLVAARSGLDTSGYSFRYVGGWSGFDAESVRATAQRVIDAADEIITAIADETTDSEPTEDVTPAAAPSEQRSSAAAGIVEDRPAPPSFPELTEQASDLSARSDALADRARALVLECADLIRTADTDQARDRAVAQLHESVDQLIRAETAAYDARQTRSLLADFTPGLDRPVEAGVDERQAAGHSSEGSDRQVRRDPRITAVVESMIMQPHDNGPADQIAVSALIEDLVRGNITAEEMGAALTYDDSRQIRPSNLQAEWLEWVIDEFDPRVLYFRDTINQALSGLTPGDDLDERLAVARVLAVVSEDLHSVEKTVCAARGQEAPSRRVLIKDGFFDHVEQNLALPADERRPYRAPIPLRRITDDADTTQATALDTDNLSAVLSRHLDDAAIKDAAGRCATPGTDADAVGGEPDQGTGDHHIAEARDLQAQA